MSLRKFSRAAFATIAFTALFASHPFAALGQAVKLPEPIQTEVPIPIAEKINGYAGGKVDDFATYIGVIYQFAISIIGLVGAVMMIIGGFQWLTSAGDSGRIKQAKKRITNALIGLALTLSAYVLLNTINPALLQFKPLSGQLGSVATELALLPWCNDLTAKNIAVQPAGSGTACGNIGIYKQDNNTLYCMFQGDCRLKVATAPSERIATCLPHAGLNTKTVQDEIKKNPNVSLGICTPCSFISRKVATGLGYNLASACNAWMTIVSGQTLPTDDPQNKRYWSYCSIAGDTTAYPGCVQADIDCQAVNDKGPDGIIEGGINLCSFTHTCGCAGYDDAPKPTVATEDAAYDRVAGGGFPAVWHWGELDALTDHLAAVCSINPCQAYKDPRVTEGQQVGSQTLHQESFKNGCSGPNFLKIFKGVRNFVADCRNP